MQRLCLGTGYSAVSLCVCVRACVRVCVCVWKWEPINKLLTEEPAHPAVASMGTLGKQFPIVFSRLIVFGLLWNSGVAWHLLSWDLHSPPTCKPCSRRICLLKDQVLEQCTGIPVLVCLVAIVMFNMACFFFTLLSFVRVWVCSVGSVVSLYMHT